MIIIDLSKASPMQDKIHYPNSRLLKSMDTIGYLETSMHEVLLSDNNDMYYTLYSFDAKSSIGYGTKIPYSSHVQLYKKLISYTHENLQDFIYINSPQVCWSYVATSYKGQNIGIDMYSFIIRKYGALWSDVKHTVGARKLWEQLCMQHHVSLVDFSTGTIILDRTYSHTDGWYEKKELMLLAR